MTQISDPARQLARLLLTALVEVHRNENTDLLDDVTAGEGEDEIWRDSGEQFESEHSVTAAAPVLLGGARGPVNR